MRPRTTAVRLAAAAGAGGALAMTVEVGAALLLYGGRGALLAGGGLFGVSLAALGAGLWAGGGAADAPLLEAPPSLWRWRGAAGSLLLAALFAGLWLRATALRDVEGARAIAVLALIGLPGYAHGSLLAALHGRAAAERAARGGPGA